MEFLETMRRYFEHANYEPKEIDKWIADVDVISRLPLTLRERVIAELNKWGRDDFVNIGGYLEALHIVATWWYAVGQHVEH